MELTDDRKIKISSKTTPTSAKFLIAITGGLGIGLSVVCASFVAPAFRRFCLPYVPATSEQISNVLACLPKNASGKLLDIGSGDGRIVVAAAKHGLISEGVELNPWLVLYSRLSSLRQGVFNQTRFSRQNLWTFDITPYNYIVIFGVEQMMKDLQQKLISESPHDLKVIACRFPLPNLQPVKTIEDGVNTVWLYDLQKRKEL